MSGSARHPRPMCVWAIHVVAIIAVIAGIFASDTGPVQAAPDRGGQSFFRYVGRPELDAIQETGLLRGGRPGDTFWTDAEFTSAAEAQDKLALPVTPELRVRFIIVSNPTLTRNGSVVEPAFGGAGGGREWASPDPVQVEIIDVQPLT